jgi:hypothetical protein
MIDWSAQGRFYPLAICREAEIRPLAVEPLIR